jgi:hypothetical protein
MAAVIKVLMICLDPNFIGVPVLAREEYGPSYEWEDAYALTSSPPFKFVY